MRRPRGGGGWPAIRYVLDIARRVGPRRLWGAMRSRNACKTCALGMGGQAGAMRNESGHWPEVCKKSLQAMAADMQDGIRPEFFERYSLSELRTLSPRELESLGRIVNPLLAEAGATHYRTIEWDEALSRLAERLRAAPPEQCFFYVSGRSSNEAAFLIQLFARIFGTNHVSNCSYYCHQASGVGLGETIGVGTATVNLEDVEQADLFFLIGGNPASNHPRLMRTLAAIRRRGGAVIVINPLRERGLEQFRVPSDVRSLLFGSSIASLYLQPHIGGDIALLTGIARAVIERGAADEAYARRCTEGWEAFRDHAISADWSEIERSSGVPRAQIEQAAEMYSRSQRAVFGWTMGITHHVHGVQNVHAIVNLALLRGMVGRPHAGLLPIRGHSNVQGIGSVGVTPRLKQALFERLQSHFGVILPTTPGFDTLGCLEAADRGEMRVGICLGGNLYGATPDSGFARRALGRVESVTYLSTTMNLGHAWGLGGETLVLPVLARDEEPQKTTQESMFNFVRLSDGGPARHVGPRSETAVLAELARRVLGESGPIDWRALERHESLRAAIAAIVPGYEKLSDIDATGREFHVGGRRVAGTANAAENGPTFPTPSGKARFTCVAIPAAALPGCVSEPAVADGRALRLMTLRSEGQFNTVVYEEEDLYRWQERRDVILLNPADLARLGLREDQLVTVRSRVGVMHTLHARAFDIRAGNAAMYYPEANVLVPLDRDLASRTPAFKNVTIILEPQAGPIAIDATRPVELTVGGDYRPRPLNAC